MKEIRSLEAAITSFLTLDPLITGQRMAVFLFIARNEGCSVKDIYKGLGSSQQAVHKHIKFLVTPEEYGEKRALGIVQMREVADPLPRKELSLTPKGRKMVENLKHTISGR